MRVRNIIITVTALAFTIFQIYTSGVRVLPAMQQRSVHLALGLMLVFLLHRTVRSSTAPKIGRSIGTFVDGVLVILSALIGFYIYYFYVDISMRMGSATTLDIAVSVIAIILVLEGSRRVIGFALPIISIFFLLFSWFGKYLPPLIGHGGYSFKRVVDQMFLGTEGILGMPLGVSTTAVAGFVIFGAFLDASGAGKMFIDLALALFGKMRGGAAKVAVIASSLMGMVSGSQVANVATTGVLTIPLMKRGGYPAPFAGAVEAVASSGGQLMPPIMGATAFVMAELLTTSYTAVMKAAIFPAVLYYLAVFIMVDRRAAKLGGLRIKEEIPDALKVLKEKWHLVIPVLLLLFFLIIVRTTPNRAAFWAIVAIPIVAAFSAKTRMSFRQIVEAMEQGAKSALVVIASTASAGIVIGIIQLSGLGLRLSNIILSITHGQLLPLLLLSAVVSIILGMGLPPVGCYLILAVTAAPAIVQAGIDPMAAHLFIFYFGIISAITPPIAVAAFAASGIAKCNPMSVALAACKLGLAAFIVPFMFAYGPELILKGSILSILLSVLTAVLGVWALAVALEGFLGGMLSMPIRIFLGVLSLFLIVPEAYTDLIGLAAVGSVVLYRFKLAKKTDSQLEKLEG